jgi:hypothetical protein
VSAAAALLEAWARELGVDRALVEAAFEHVPLDFPVHFRARLPLAAHRAGACGITLFGRVYLLHHICSWPPLDRLAILRHEAEHVRQQRADRLFYLRYGADWLGRFLRPEGARNLRSRLRGAYRAIGAEREAYAAERRAREILATRS